MAYKNGDTYQDHLRGEIKQAREEYYTCLRNHDGAMDDACGASAYATGYWSGRLEALKEALDEHNTRFCGRVNLEDI